MTNIHPLQSKKWGEFRKKTGIKVVTGKNFLLTIHPVPKTNFTIGYLPKGNNIDQELLNELEIIGKNENCIFIQIEPNIEKGEIEYNFNKLVPAAHPLFTKYNFILDISKSEEEILKNMSQKTRYNIRLAEKKGVTIYKDNSENAFKDYLRLTNETTKRQNFYSHTQEYHQLMWDTLKTSETINKDELSAHLFTARYNNETLAAWILFVLGDTLYYPYGSSSSKHREVMASNLLMWEAIKFGKSLGLKNFDMWGALGTNPNPKDPWFGFHRFKQGYNPRAVEYVGSFDLVINNKMYFIYKIADKIRWALLKFK